MAHIRRKFFEAKDHYPQAAEYALREIATCYANERKYRKTDLVHRRDCYAAGRI
jgi:hypothetical protein